MERRIIGEKAITYSEAREILARVREERARERGAEPGEGGVEEEKGLGVIDEVLEYLSKAAPRQLSAKESRELVEKLKELGVKEVVAVVVANICPRSKGELMAILQMDREISVLDVAEKVYPVVGEYCSK